MKILYVVPNPNRIGGVSTSILRVTNYLTEQGIDIEIFCPDLEAESKLLKSEMMLMKDLLTGKMMQEFTQRIIDRIKQSNPDLIVGYYGSSTGYCATVAAKFLDMPVIVCLRGNDINRDFFSSFHAHKLTFIAQNASAITTVSSEMSQKVSAWLGVSSSFISNSVDKSVFFNSRNEVSSYKKSLNLSNSTIIGLFGEFKASRGIHILNYLKDELKDKQVLIFGQVRTSLKKQIPSFVTVLPYIKNRDELRVAYSICDVILQPSRYDGMPNVVLEAMACERIVVASSTGGIKDIIDHGQTGFLCNSEEEWKKNLDLAIKKVNSRMGVSARKNVPEVKQEAEAFLNLFNEVIIKSSS
jgi:glycosyltransferase involved in cell wall biosynthesis